MARDDIVRDFLRRARTLHPKVPPVEWLRLECEIRAQWGGTRHYVARHAPSAEREPPQPAE